MSLIWQAGDFNESVNFGNPAALNAVDPCTFVAWVRPSSLGTNRYILSKDSDKPMMRLTDSSGNIRVIWTHTGDDLDASTTDDPMVANVWQFVAVVIDTSDSGSEIAVYVGDLDTLPVTSTISITPPTGTLQSNAGRDLLVGNRYQNDRQWQGDMYWCGYWSKAMTLAEVRELWHRIHMHDRDNCLLWCYLGESDTLPVKDQSGNNHDGTVVVVSRSSAAPLWSPLGFDDAVTGPTDSAPALQVTTESLSVPVAVVDAQVAIDGAQQAVTDPVIVPVTITHATATPTGNIDVNTVALQVSVSVADAIATVESAPITLPTTAINVPVSVNDATIELAGIQQSISTESVIVPVIVRDAIVFGELDDEASIGLDVGGLQVWTPQQHGVQAL